MMTSFRRLLLATAASLLAGPALAATPAVTPTYKHVLLISVDGLHAIDLTNYLQNNPASNFAKLAAHGIVYPNAFTTAPSDSYPGMLAQVTGASPKTAGLFYDDSYDREEYPSKNSYVSQGLADPGCTGKPGTEVTNFEELDRGYNFTTASSTTSPAAERSTGSTPSSTRTTCSARSSAVAACRSIRTATSARTRSSRSLVPPVSTPPGRTSIRPTRT